MPTCLVTGGAGFLGSHLCDELLRRGNRVICVDNLETGSLRNIEHIRVPEFEFVQADIAVPFFIEEPVQGHPARGVAELISRTRDAVGGREPLAFTRGPALIRRVGIVSGGGSDYLGDAIAAGMDAFILGEPSERIMNQAHEVGIHVLAVGHYATETFGVRRMGELLASELGVQHVFLDVPNPL